MMHVGGSGMDLTMHQSGRFGRAFRKHDHHDAFGRVLHEPDHASVRHGLVVPFEGLTIMMYLVGFVVNLTMHQFCRFGRAFRRPDYSDASGRALHGPDHASAPPVWSCLSQA